MELRGIKLESKDFILKSDEVYINTNITKKNPGMLFVYANWCGFCVKFKSTFNELQQQLGSDFPLVSLEDIELNKNTTLSKSLQVQGFPTIKFFDQNGKIIGNYNKNRDKQTIIEHICKVYHHCINYH
jgi:thiol-disulfide isomerase/thioredoxin